MIHGVDEKKFLPEAMQDKMKELHDRNIIQPGSSEWASFAFLVAKPSGKWRLVHNYVYLNTQTVRDEYPLPRIDDALNALQGKRFYSSLDILQGFRNIPLTEDSKKLTAFNAGGQTWVLLQYTRRYLKASAKVLPSSCAS